MPIEVLEEMLKKLKEYPASIWGDKDFVAYIRQNDGRLSPLYDIQKVSINYHLDEPCLILEIGKHIGLNEIERDEYEANLHI